MDVLFLDRRKNARYLGLAAIVLVALYLRTSNLSWGIPGPDPFLGRYLSYLYPDEPNLVQQIRGMLSNPLNNSPFIYPPLHAQLAAILAWPLQLTSAHSLYLLARLISVMASVLTIVCIYGIGRHWSKRTALAAAAFLAVSMTSVREAHWANPESLCALFIALSLFFLYRLRMKSGAEIGNLAMMSASIGLAICAKYYGVFFLHIPILAMGEYGLEKVRFSRKHLYRVVVCYGTIVSLVAILLLPYVYYNRGSFVGTWKYIAGWESAENGLYGTFPKPITRPNYSLNIFPVALGYPIYLLALSGIAVSLLSRQTAAILLLIAILPFWVVLETFHYRPIRFSVSLLPVLCLFAAIFVDCICRSQRKLAVTLGRFVFASSFAYSFAYSAAFVNAFNVKSDVRRSVEQFVGNWPVNRSQIAMLADNWTSNSIGLVKYTGIDHFNGDAYDYAQRPPSVIVVPRVFLEILKQCVELHSQGYSYSEGDWWPMNGPAPEVLALAQDLIREKTYQLAGAFKNHAEFAGFRFRDDTLKFDYFWVTNLEVLVFQER